MVAMMAVEVFVQLYIVAFILSAIIAICLLVYAARRFGHDDRGTTDALEPEPLNDRLTDAP